MCDHLNTEPQGLKEKHLAMDMAEQIANAIENDKTKLGGLLCEGLDSSIDRALYSAVYPNLVVLPSNGCTDVIKMLPRVRKYSEYPVFGIIDRDNRSKQKLKQLAAQGVYATKLPFIENIICCPEVLKVICRKYNMDYGKVIHKVKSSLAAILAEKLSYLNPFNLEIPRESSIRYVRIIIATEGQTVNKNIDLNNIMYTFRDKLIVSEVASAMGRSGKEWYYKFIAKELSGDDKDELTLIMGKYLPVIKITED
ncbi:MAG: DUF4435 domain-containing protein [Clostridia bacterium]|nr:DUF4435 domain-containing protein [Clostridia bacterium]